MSSEMRTNAQCSDAYYVAARTELLRAIQNRFGYFIHHKLCTTVSMCVRTYVNPFVLGYHPYLCTFARLQSLSLPSCCFYSTLQKHVL